MPVNEEVGSIKSLHFKKGEEDMKMGGLVVLIIIGAMLVGGFMFYGYAVSVRNQALDHETSLSAQYNANRNELSTYVSSFYEQLGVANLKSDRMDQYILGAMQGRYGDDGMQGGGLLLAFQEAYPDPAGLEIYDKILPSIQSGREGFRNVQNKIIDQARAYDRWRKDGIVRAWILSGVYPSDDLHISVGDETLTAMAALSHLQNPVIDSTTREAFETMEMEPLVVPSAQPQQ